MSQQFKRSNKDSETIQNILAALVFNDKDLLKKASLTKPSANSEHKQANTRCAECLEKATIASQESAFICPRCRRQ